MIKDIKIRNEVVAAKFSNMMLRFGYKTNAQFIEDMLYFFETNPVSPKDRFDSLFDKLNSKMEEFNKDNNRVIAVVRNIEKVKLDPIIRSIGSEIAEDLRIIKKRLLFDEVKVLDNNSVEKIDNIPVKNEVKKGDIDIDKLTESYEKKITKHIDDYGFLQKEYDKITLENGKFHNKLKKLKENYSVENSAFSKGKIIINLSEEEFLNLINNK